LSNRNTGKSWGSDTRGNAWHNLKGNAGLAQGLRLFPSSAKNKWISPFQSDNSFAFFCIPQKKSMNLTLFHSPSSRCFSRIDPFRSFGSPSEESWIDQPIIKHHLSLG
jgi:hypothetical protein